MKGIYLETVFEVHVSILDPSSLFFLDGKKQRTWFPTGLQSWPISQSFLDYQLTSPRPHSKGLYSLKRLYIPLLQDVICCSVHTILFLVNMWGHIMSEISAKLPPSDCCVLFREARTRPRSKRFHFQSMPRMKSNLGWWHWMGLVVFLCSRDPQKEQCKYLNLNLNLVGGFNPFEKYSSIWIISPGRGWKYKKNWNHHLVNSFISCSKCESCPASLQWFVVKLRPQKHQPQPSECG